MEVINKENHKWAVGDVFTTTFWGATEVCIIRSISEKYVIFNRLESIRDGQDIEEDFCAASMEIYLFNGIRKTFLHHSEWYIEYEIILNTKPQ